MSDQFIDAGNGDGANIGGSKAKFVAQILKGLDGCVSIDTASAALDTNVHAFPFFSQPVSERVELGRIGKTLTKAEFAFEDAFGTGKAAASQLRCSDAAF